MDCLIGFAGARNSLGEAVVVTGGAGGLCIAAPVAAGAACTAGP